MLLQTVKLDLRSEYSCYQVGERGDSCTLTRIATKKTSQESRWYHYTSTDRFGIPCNKKVVTIIHSDMISSKSAMSQDRK
jgi:hypothetical protein